MEPANSPPDIWLEGDGWCMHARYAPPYVLCNLYTSWDECTHQFKVLFRARRLENKDAGAYLAGRVIKCARSIYSFIDVQNLYDVSRLVEGIRKWKATL